MTAEDFKLFTLNVLAAHHLGILKRGECPVLKVTGRDSERYLQGRITQDIKNLANNSAARSMLLTPQGKVQGIFSIAKLRNYLWLIPECSSDELGNFVQALLQFKVADEINLEVVRFTRTSVLLPTADLPSSISSGSYVEFPSGGFATVLPAGTWSAVEIVSAEDGLSADLLKEWPNADPLAYHTLRVALGIPEWGVEISDKTSAAELPLSQYVSFSKGCYAGQEVVERADSRGRAPRRLTQFFSTSALTVGAEIKIGADQVGIITSVGKCPQGYLALGFLKNSPEVTKETLSLEFNRF